jgi:hypothetical protein
MKVATKRFNLSEHSLYRIKILSEVYYSNNVSEKPLSFVSDHILPEFTNFVNTFLSGSEIPHLTMRPFASLRVTTLHRCHPEPKL